MDPGFPVVPVGPWTFFVAALDKVQYDYHPHAAQYLINNISVFPQYLKHSQN
jgi:hypothetical protein